MGCMWGPKVQFGLYVGFVCALYGPRQGCMWDPDRVHLGYMWGLSVLLYGYHLGCMWPLVGCMWAIPGLHLGSIWAAYGPHLVLRVFYGFHYLFI